MPIPQPTVDELIEVIKRSALPTLLVEGTCDAYVYRLLESRLMMNGSVLGCGGRGPLLTLFGRRAELTGKNCAFLADQDMYIYSRIPDHYREIIWTIGYSIENDLYDESDIEDLLAPAESAEHPLVVAAVCRWFAFEVEQFRAGRPAHVDHHVSEVVPIGDFDICAGFIATRSFVEPDPETVREILTNYRLRLRGKTLFQCLVRFLSARGRTAKYSHSTLLEICAKKRGHPHVARLIAEILGRLAPMGPIPLTP